MAGRVRRSVVLACGIAALLVFPALAAAPVGVPARFVGVNVDDPLYADTAAGVNLSQQLGLMEQTGVESVRVVFSWAFAQPYASWSDVPASDRSQYTSAGGVPTNFSQMDEIVGLAARYGLTVLPTVLYAPGWDIYQPDGMTFGEPARTGPYAAFLTDLIERYGPHGSFWTGRSGPKVPIRQWQIWNEPDISGYWPTQPFARTYVALLKASHSAIKKADPGAQVVLGGLVNYSWKDLETIYKVAGARAAFDVAAVHPYTAEPSGVITILQRVRRVMDQNGDPDKPMIADEFSWTSAKGQTAPLPGLPISLSEQGQANNIAALLPLFARDRRRLGLAAFYYFTWAGDEVRNGQVFAFAGLLRYANGKLTKKPAFFSFEKAALAMEHCTRKGRLATVCAQRS